MILAWAATVFTVIEHWQEHFRILLAAYGSSQDNLARKRSQTQMAYRRSDRKISWHSPERLLLQPSWVRETRQP